MRIADVVTAPERRAAYEAAGLWDAETLAGRVARSGADRPGAVAVVDAAGPHTYGELADQVGRARPGSSPTGASRPADVVSVQLPNRYEAVVAAVAVQSLGGGHQPAAAQLPAPASSARRGDRDAPRRSSPRPSTGASTTGALVDDGARRHRRRAACTCVVDDGAGGGDASYAELLERPRPLRLEPRRRPTRCPS